MKHHMVSIMFYSLGNIWWHLKLFWVVTAWEGSLVIPGEQRPDPAKHHSVHRTAPPAQSYLPSNIDSAEGGNPDCDPHADSSIDNLFDSGPDSDSDPPSHPNLYLTLTLTLTLFHTLTMIQILTFNVVTITTTLTLKLILTLILIFILILVYIFPFYWIYWGDIG